MTMHRRGGRARLCRLNGLQPNSVLAPSSFFVTTSKALVTRSDALVTSSFLLLVAMPGAPSSVLAPSSGSLCS